MGNIAYCLLNHSRARHFESEIIGINWSSMHLVHQSRTEIIIGIQLIIEVIGTTELHRFQTSRPFLLVGLGNLRSKSPRILLLGLSG